MAHVILSLSDTKFRDEQGKLPLCARGIGKYCLLTLLNLKTVSEKVAGTSLFIVVLNAA